MGLVIMLSGLTVPLQLAFPHLFFEAGIAGEVITGALTCVLTHMRVDTHA